MIFDRHSVQFNAHSLGRRYIGSDRDRFVCRCYSKTVFQYGRLIYRIWIRFTVTDDQTPHSQRFVKQCKQSLSLPAEQTPFQQFVGTRSFCTALSASWLASYRICADRENENKKKSQSTLINFDYYRRIKRAGCKDIWEPHQQSHHLLLLRPDIVESSHTEVAIRTCESVYAAVWPESNPGRSLCRVDRAASAWAIVDKGFRRDSRATDLALVDWLLQWSTWFPMPGKSIAVRDRRHRAPRSGARPRSKPTRSTRLDRATLCWTILNCVPQIKLQKSAKV